MNDYASAARALYGCLFFIGLAIGLILGMLILWLF